jgi:hypothetical protein
MDKTTEGTTDMTNQNASEAPPQQPAIDYAATNKHGVLLHIEGETKDERRKRLARETQKARRDFDETYAQSRRDASIKSHKKARENDPELQAKRLERLEKLAADMGYKIVALPAKKAK